MRARTPSKDEHLLEIAKRFGYSSACISRWRIHGITQPTIRKALKRVHDLETRTSHGRASTQPAPQPELERPPPQPQKPVINIIINSDSWGLYVGRNLQATGFIHTDTNFDRIAEALASILITLNRKGQQP